VSQTLAIVDSADWPIRFVAMARGAITANVAQRRPAAVRTLAASLLGAAALLLNKSSAPGAPAFTPSRQPPSLDKPSFERADKIACFAEDGVALEEPPTEATEKKRYTPNRDRRGTLCFARRELNEEAWRFLPYLEPLLDAHMSIREITFALNRQGSELRHLLYRPRLGLPVFTEHKVRRILRRNKTEKGRLNNFARPRHLPPRAPGAPYPAKLGDVFAEVPPLAPWQPKTITTSMVKDLGADYKMKGLPVNDKRGSIFVEETKGLFIGDAVKVGAEDATIQAITWVGDYWELVFTKDLEKDHTAGTAVTKNA